MRFEDLSRPHLLGMRLRCKHAQGRRPMWRGSDARRLALNSSVPRSQAEVDALCSQGVQWCIVCTRFDCGDNMNRERVQAQPFANSESHVRGLFQANLTEQTAGDEP